ncbi:hypothetical protein OSTOST_21629, partial [Ostertagia ostertagi]
MGLKQEKLRSNRAAQSNKTARSDIEMIATMAYIIRNWETYGNELLKKFNDQHYLLAALKGLRNGVVWSPNSCPAPHALVMVFLFGEG